MSSDSLSVLDGWWIEGNDLIGVIRSAIALNGSYFNAQRMLAQYLQNAYARASKP